MGMQLIDIAKNGIMKENEKQKRSSSRRKHRDRKDDDRLRYHDGDFVDVEQGRDHKHRRHHRHERGKPKRESSQSRALMPQRTTSVEHSILPLKSPKHHGHDFYNDRLNPFMLPPGCKLSPRSDVWMLLSLSSVVTLGSISLGSPPNGRRTSEKTALISSSLLFTISIIVGCGYRYAPFRESLTRTPNHNMFGLRCSKETIIAALNLALAAMVTAIVMNPALYIGMGGDAMWNANVFCAGWTELYACFYLVADLLTTNDPRGLIKYKPHSPRGLSYFDSAAKIWYMLLGSTTCVVGVLLDFSSSVCAPPLNASTVCERALGAGFLSIFSLLLNLSALAVYRISLLGEMNRSRLNCFNGAERAYKTSRGVGTMLSFFVFVLQSTVVGVVSSSSGPGLEAGSIFLTSWLSFGLSLISVKMYIESFCIPLAPSMPKETLHFPIKAKQLLDHSSRSIGTNATDPMDSSNYVTDDERQEQANIVHPQYYERREQTNIVHPQYYCIEEQKPGSHHSSHQEKFHIALLMHSSKNQARVQSVNAHSTNPYSLNERGEESDEASLYSKPVFNAIDNSIDGRSKRSVDPTGSNASVSSETEPMVFIRKQSNVSTLGIGSIVTQEPVGMKSGSSYHGDIAPDSGAQEPVSMRHRRDPSFDHDAGSYHNLYAPTVLSTTDDEEDDKPKQEQGVNSLQRRASNCSLVPSLAAVPEGSIESSSIDNTNSSRSCKRRGRREKANRTSLTSKKSESSSKISKSSRKYKHKIERKGSDGSSSLSDPKTINDNEFKRCQRVNVGSSSTVNESDFNVVCDSNSIVTEITTEGFEDIHRVPTFTPRQLPRLPAKNPLYNGSGGSTTSGQVTPRLNAFDSSVDDLVASALQYARKSKQSKASNNASAKTLTTLSPGPSCCSSRDRSIRPGSVSERHQEEKHYQMNEKRKTNSKRAASDTKSGSNINSSAVLKAKRRGSLQSLYSIENSGDGMDGLGIDFAC